jgi:hypothetical protein
VQDLVKSGGMEASYAAASGGGDVMPNDGKTLLHVKNGGGGAITVTIAAVVASKDVGVGYGLYTRANVAVVVDAAEERFIGPLPDRAFNNASGQAAISYSGVTSVTVAALKMPL